MRPLLQSFESESVWHVETNQIKTCDPISPYDKALDQITFDLKRKLLEKQKFNFNNNCFGPEVKTKQVYKEVVKPIISKLLSLERQDGTVFMYG